MSLTLPTAVGAAASAGTLTVRAAGAKAKTVKIAGRTAFTAAAGMKVARTATALTVTGLPAAVVEVRLTMTTARRLGAKGVAATLAAAGKTRRLTARAVGTR